MNDTALDFDYLRQQIVGIDSAFQTPYGRRLMSYCDYTASGRCLLFVERYLQGLQKIYANTHTEDDLTGRSMTKLLHEAEHMIKSAVNAGPNGRLVACGTGATGAIDKFQQIVGVALPPATAEHLRQELRSFLGEEDLEKFRAHRRAHEPVVFVGPYEHHSNEVSWRQGLATVVEVNLAEDGGVDMQHLEALLQEPKYQGRLRIGSFSAASNVTGMKTRVHEVAALLHKHDALACFDFAASAPYVEINMNPEPGPEGQDRSLDAIFVSPHKFLGGPGSSGILVFNQRFYHHELPPSVGGGGTVDYVSPVDQDFVKDVEEREKAGTPGVLQTMKAALAFQIKRNLGTQRIEKREAELLERAARRWKSNPRIEIMGNQDMSRRIGIVSFNLRDPGGLYLHPKLVTVLLNDLFGIQSRAGCSCAGPYGHRLLDIDLDTSEQYREWVRKGYHGIKPGWCRVGFHFVMDNAEADYVIEAVHFLADFGYRFLSEYDFDMHSGMWQHRNYEEKTEPFTLAAAVKSGSCDQTALPLDVRVRLYESYLNEALAIAEDIGEPDEADRNRLKDQFGKLQFFAA